MLITNSRYRGTQAYYRVFAEVTRAAEYRGTITYQDIAQILGLSSTGNLLGREVGQIQGKITDDENGQNRPTLSACINRSVR